MKQWEWRRARRHGPAAMAALALAGCAATPQLSGPPFGEVAAPRGSAALLLERRLGEIVAEQHVVTAGVGVIRDGKLVWSAYFGEQAPGLPASAATRFNTASITKTVTAETILRLVGQGKLSLDEPMATYWVDPDIATDPRRFDLTPRIALTHKTGFLNWRFFRRDGKLAFERAPGDNYGYSGEGFQYLARFAERKLGKPFPQLVDETVLRPLGMVHTDFTVHAENAGKIARPVDEGGIFYGTFCRPEGKAFCRKQGDWSAAADMTTTVQDYAAVLVAVRDAA
jgi:CubicO group peptidase (beta-lactamase class C family)